MPNLPIGIRTIARYVGAAGFGAAMLYGVQQFPNNSRPENPSFQATSTHATPPGHNGGQLVSETELYKRKFKYSDVHFHPTNYNQQGPDLKTLLKFMDENNIKYSVLMPIPTDQMVNDAGKKFQPAHGQPSCGCKYYISDDTIRNSTEVSREQYAAITTNSPALVYNSGVDAALATRFGKLSATEKKRFDPMITGLVLGDMNCSTALLRKLHDHPGVFTGVGEITIHKEFVEDKLPKAHQPNLTDKSKPLIKLIETCGDIGMPVVIHCDTDVMPFNRADTTEPAHFENVKKLFSQPECKKTTIIWAHAGGAGKYSQLREGHAKSLDALLSEPDFKHVNIDISWDTVAHQLTLTNGKPDKAKMQEWADLFNKHPDRFLFGSDALSPNSGAAWNSTANAYTELLKHLSPEVQEKIMLGNYERLIVGARPKVRAFEKHVLPLLADSLNMRPDNGPGQPIREEYRAAIDMALPKIKKGYAAMHAKLAGLEAK